MAAHGERLQVFTVDKELRAQDKSSKHYYDARTVYVENNNNSEARVRSIIEEIIRQSPLYKGTNVDASKKYLMRYFRDETKDFSFIRFYDTAVYDFIFALKEDGTEIDYLSGEGVPMELYSRYIKEKNKPLGNWADDDEIDLNTQLVFQLHPNQVPGQTPISRDDRGLWNKSLRNSTDIALIRAFVKEVYDGLTQNVLTIRNVPRNWSEDETIRFFRKFSLSTSPLYPEIIVIKSKQGMREDSYVSITFDPEFKEASFAILILNGLSVLGAGANKHILRATYPKGPKVKLIKPATVKKSKREVDDDGFRRR